MSTQQDIYAASSESRPPMLNKENYIPWSSRLLRYAKSRPNGKLIHNSILNGPYVRRMIAEPGDGERDVNVNETFHEQTDDELSERELKQLRKSGFEGSGEGYGSLSTDLGLLKVQKRGEKGVQGFGRKEVYSGLNLGDRGKDFKDLAIMVPRVNKG
nr:Gag-Pol polyprotein [Tanacetum cinerariifolium]